MQETDSVPRQRAAAQSSLTAFGRFFVESPEMSWKKPSTVSEGFFQDISDTYEFCHYDWP
jgi:hypothetical protein